MAVIDQTDIDETNVALLAKAGLGIDGIGVALMALREDRWRDEKTIEFVRNALVRGLSALAPVREMVREIVDQHEARDATRH
jgi:hypothetical protein